MPGPQPQEKRHKINLTPSQVAASALAASCAALVASTLGVAGTLIGAAVGSVITTTGAAVYSHLFRTSGKRIADTLNSVGSSPLRTPGTSRTAADERASAETARMQTAPMNTAPMQAAPMPVPMDMVPMETVVAETAKMQSIPADRLYGADADDRADAIANAPTASGTPALWTPQSSDPADPAAALAPLREAREPALEPEQGSTQATGRSARFRKPIALAAAIAAVFGVSVLIGMVAGQPIRQATGSNGPDRPHSTAPQTPASGSGGGASSTESGNPSGSPSAASPSTAPGSSAPSSPSGGAPTSNGGATSGPNQESTATVGGSDAFGTPMVAGSADPAG
jgi:hypothetical protein